MSPYFNETLDGGIFSWVDSANRETTDFPLQNLPFGVFRRGQSNTGHIGVAIGDYVLDLQALSAQRSLANLPQVTMGACQSDSLNKMMALDRAILSDLRRTVFQLLKSDAIANCRSMLENCLLPMQDVELQLPVHVGDYTDFYASIYHATNVGRLFRPDNPLLPNYKWVPIGYHGRSSSLVVSGKNVLRPKGQIRPDKNAPPVYAMSRALDYELEVGVYVSRGNSLGQTIAVSNAEEHLFGISLVNDWSARDIQSWEYQPLGPFLGKSFATSVSPWVVTMEALEPFRCPALSRPVGDPQPLGYLDSKENRGRGGIALTLESSLTTFKMREEGMPPFRLCLGTFQDMYWTLAQLLTHHASNGCNLRPGDLLASGTVSGDSPSSRGCLLELTLNGKDRIQLPTGESRAFLEDGDELILRGWCEKPGARRIGLGECRGRVVGS